MLKFLFSLLVVAILESCTSPPSSPNGGAPKLFETDLFKSYWYSGKAEVNSYKLEQSRYGEAREGKAVLIFVTEDFSAKKQVKLDAPSKAGSDKINVLKLNFTKNFVTGIYPYSMMLSVFSPVSADEHPHPLKVTMTSQEWCGQVFSQMNLVGARYAFKGHSYFEKEGDNSFSLQATILEDELWSRIRLDPESLPLGNWQVVPGLFFTRLRHSELKSMNALFTKSEDATGIFYGVNLPDQGRMLTIRYQKGFPHKILGWEESFTERGQSLTTRATLDKTLIIDYWTKNKNEFRYLRDSLGLSPNNY